MGQQKSERFSDFEIRWKNGRSLTLFYGKQSVNFQLTMLEILQPAIDLAEAGFPITEVTQWGWQKGSKFDSLTD